VAVLVPFEPRRRREASKDCADGLAAFLPRGVQIHASTEYFGARALPAEIMQKAGQPGGPSTTGYKDGQCTRR
jgi:hypothetical protein